MKKQQSWDRLRQACASAQSLKPSLLAHITWNSGQTLQTEPCAFENLAPLLNVRNFSRLYKLQKSQLAEHFLLLLFSNCRVCFSVLRPPSLISDFVVRCLDRIKPILATPKISRLLTSPCSRAGQFEYYLVANLRTQVSSWRGLNDGIKRLKLNRNIYWLFICLTTFIFIGLG